MGCEKLREGVRTGGDETVPFIDNQLWSVTRLAEYFDVPIRTIQDWVYKHLIPFIKVGRHVRFNPSDVQRWLSERSHGNGHPKD